MYLRLLIHDHHTAHILVHAPRSPNFVHLDDKLSRGTRFVILHRVPDLDVQLSRILITLPTRENPGHDGAFVSSYRFVEEENRLLPMRRLALWPRTETRYPLLTRRLAPSLTRPSFRLESPSKRPNLSDDRRALVRDLDLGRWRDRRSERGEERVKV